MLVPLDLLNNIKIIKYFKCEPRFNDVFSRNNLPRIKVEACVINLDDKIVKEHIQFYYLLTKIQLCTLILLGLNTVCSSKSIKQNQRQINYSQYI